MCSLLFRHFLCKENYQLPIKSEWINITSKNEFNPDTKRICFYFILVYVHIQTINMLDQIPAEYVLAAQTKICL